MANLYGDENFPRLVVEGLRALGHDVLTASEAGRSNLRISDDEVLKFAIAAGRAVLTLDRHDFRRLHAQFPEHRGIVACRPDPSFAALAERIHVAIQGRDLAGLLVRIRRDGVEYSGPAGPNTADPA